VAKSKKNNAVKTKKTPGAQPWISMRRGIEIITITSIFMAILTAWEVVPQRGWLEGILWGLLFGVLIWVIFFGLIYINRLLRR